MPPLDAAIDITAAAPPADLDLADPVAHPTPSPADAATPATPLAPIRRHNPDGWTAERQRAFIEVLADSGSVARAADAVGMSRESAYRLRRRPGAHGFVVAWEAATSAAVQRLADNCLERAIHGDEIPVYAKGEIVGTRRRYPDALAMFLLRMRDPLRHGPLVDTVSAKRRLSSFWKFHDHVRLAIAQLPDYLGALRTLPADARGEGEGGRCGGEGGTRAKGHTTM